MALSAWVRPLLVRVVISTSTHFLPAKDKERVVDEGEGESGTRNCCTSLTSCTSDARVMVCTSVTPPCNRCTYTLLPPVDTPIRGTEPRLLRKVTV